jgi:plasmid replication initiation protein
MDSKHSLQKTTNVDSTAIDHLRNKQLVQHNAIVRARYDMTVIEKNVIYMLLAQLHDADPPNKVYYISVKDIERLTGKEINYGQFEKSTMRLVTRGYTIKEGDEILQIAVVSSVRHIKNQGMIAVKFDSDIRPYLFNLKDNFTKFGFLMAMSLQSIYSKRLYEMLSQFKSTGIMRISIDEIKYRLCIIDPQTKKDKYAIWTAFANKVLNIAQRELEQLTDINFTYKAKKRGRKYTDLEFNIKYQPQKLVLPEVNPMKEVIYNRLTERHQLSKWQADLILQKIPESDIHKTLYDIQVKNINGEINNMGGFTATTFENVHKIGLLGKTT